MCYMNCKYENRDGDCRHKGGPPRVCPHEEEENNAEDTDDTENTEDMETA